MKSHCIVIFRATNLQSRSIRGKYSRSKKVYDIFLRGFNQLSIDKQI